VKFAIFYEIPVPRPWSRESERRAYQDTIAQVVAADRAGWHGFWTVEHHFLEEYSHCSNPEVLYGAIAGLTENIRIGYGVRLQPEPYNHPVRSAESVAVLDLISGGRVDYGTGRSTTRTELEGFGIHPKDTREMWREAVEATIGCWTNDEYEFEGKYWSMPRRAVVPKPYQDPHPPVFGATGSKDGHQMMGQLGLGLCSFSLGVSTDELTENLAAYRSEAEQCTKPLGSVVNNQTVVFTMMNCAPTKADSYEVAKPNYEWYFKTATEIISTVPAWLEELETKDSTYDYLNRAAKAVERGRHTEVTFEQMLDMGAAVAGDPDEVIERCKAYEAAGTDILLCMLNPYAVPHENSMRSIELMAKYVLPEFGQ
jgi:alkanesulfonate monooxygenase SsuD/methylene tetrahydromethanopterin reductase-like flavin-dependent oxidoreductase (luciferase family)